MAYAWEGQSSAYGARRSPVGLAGTIAVHALLLGAFLLLPKEMITRHLPPGIVGYPVPQDPPPPPNSDTPSDPAKPDTRSTTTTVDPIFPPPFDDSALRPADPPVGPVGDGGSIGSGEGTTVRVPDPPAPVLVEAAIDPRHASAFQPDYPPSMIRLEKEGHVTVRVSIGVDGRVTAVERLSASDDAFWAATERQALRKWRFRPATRDGAPVASTKVLTVRFRLADL
ncbi:protein TonB [Sphingobium fontiphilum]|uniref:Protein TonB n=1 Tax=Sphingobium fontiphilum TaxID=944425 RepID=A0A7W6DL15_9SPHN|nr:energy transducer TonB [Sphingobium fontiphilum]MBB3982542.1 protein TonB [Sphingobium fontiphilum]